ncbi:hypothetical protein PanWU01x14_209990, partial [Parasponia andersonii]
GPFVYDFVDRVKIAKARVALDREANKRYRNWKSRLHDTFKEKVGVSNLAAVKNSRPRNMTVRSSRLGGSMLISGYIPQCPLPMVPPRFRLQPTLPVQPPIKDGDHLIDNDDGDAEDDSDDDMDI